MNTKNFNNSLFLDLKDIILNKILIFMMTGSFITGIINLVNERPLINILTALGISLISIVLYKFQLRGYRFIRILFIIVFVNFYIPFGWLTSPGSTSAMPYFTILFIVVASFLVKNYRELILPALGILEVVALLRYEALHEDKFYHYTDAVYRATDLSMNYTLVMSFMVYLFFVINNYTTKRDKALFNFSVTDQLTGLYNRRYIFDTLQRLQEESSKTNEVFCIAMIDVNKFKEINDSYGHLVGDKVLISIGKLLKEFYPEEILVGRYGGDEFMLIFPKKNLKEVSKYLTSLELRFKELSKGFCDINLSFSFGVSDNKNRTIDEMVHLADRHLYKKKNIDLI